MNDEIKLERVPPGKYNDAWEILPDGSYSVRDYKGNWVVSEWPDGWVLMRPTTEPQLDWPKAKAYLDQVQKNYEEIGPAGRFGLAITIMPLQDRYERGERTEWLYNEIMELN